MITGHLGIFALGNSIQNITALHWLCLLLLAGTGTFAGWTRQRARFYQREQLRERRMREELEAYAKLDVTSTTGVAGQDAGDAARTLAKRVCRTVVEKSVFSQVAMLLRDVDGKLFAAASAGVDDLTVAAISRWGEHVVAEERTHRVVRSLTTGTGLAQGSVRISPASFTLQLGEWQLFDAEVSAWKQEGRQERRNFRRAIATPMHTRAGRLVGVLVVCGEMSASDRSMGLERALAPIEILAAKLAAGIENSGTSERLLRAEKLAGLGQLAGGVAHALNNPLTAVLGFAELIGQSSTDARVRKDASTIVGEALKMRDTVQRLIDFWRPVQIPDEAVEIAPMVQELADRCSAKLDQRGVRLIVTHDDQTPPVRGSASRLRQVFEHLLNNAAQAIAKAQAPANGERHTIRLTLTHDAHTVNVIVSDTGTGFEEPSRVFNPFYTTQQAGEGSGLGLSICYGIVREHGGEISAFNLHPHGAAVVVELPIRTTIREQPEERVLQPELVPRTVGSAVAS